MAKAPKTYSYTIVLPSGETVQEELLPDGTLVYSSDPALTARVADMVLYLANGLPVPEELSRPASEAAKDGHAPRMSR